MTFTKTSALALAFGLANALPQVPAGLAIPPGAEDLPDCAVTPLITLLTTTGCTEVTTECLCQDPAATLASIQPAIRSSCTVDSEYDEVWSYVQGFCPTSASTTSTTEAPTSSSSTTTTTEALTTTTESPTSSSSATSSTVVAQGTSTTTTTTNGTAIAFPVSIITTTVNGTSNGTAVLTSPTPTPTGDDETPIPSEGDASGYCMSFAALTIAIGCMTWIFAEL